MTELSDVQITHKSNPILLISLRIIWLALTGLMLAIFVAGIGPRARQLNQACQGDGCPFQSLSTAEAQALQDSGFSLNQYGAFHVTLETIIGISMLAFAIIIFWARFDDWFGILVSFAIMLFGLNFMVEADGAFMELHPAWQSPYYLLTAMAGVLFVLILYLFPDGRFVPRATKFVAMLFAAVGIADALLRNMAALPLPVETFSAPLNITYLVCLTVGLAAQIYRFRKVSSPTERQQTKWVLYGITMLTVCMFLYSLIVEIVPLKAGSTRLFFNTVGFAIMAPAILVFPLSMMFSILRYRLWDIDVVINRTLVYGALTAVLLLLFLASITLLQALFIRVTGQDSQAAVVLSTLLITVLFNPLRSRLQRLIDRRFYRSKYDASRVLARFAQHARDEVDLEALSLELVGTVHYTVQPKQVSLWLRDDKQR